MTLLSTLAGVFGSVGAFAMFPQVYRIFKRKSAKDISIFSMSFMLITGIIWVLYGLELDSYPLVISQLIGNLALVFIIVGWILYGRDPVQPDHRQQVTS
jgi:MtN3 and saliva related transmembrane protein